MRKFGCGLGGVAAACAALILALSGGPAGAADIGSPVPGKSVAKKIDKDSGAGAEASGYQAAIDRATKRGCPLVVFAGTPAKLVEGAESYHAEPADKFPAGVWLCHPFNRTMNPVEPGREQEAVSSLVRPAPVARVAGTENDVCKCESNPCADARCQAYGGGGQCECHDRAAQAAVTPQPVVIPAQFQPQFPPQMQAMPMQMMRGGMMMRGGSS